MRKTFRYDGYDDENKDDPIIVLITLKYEPKDRTGKDVFTVNAEWFGNQSDAEGISLQHESGYILPRIATGNVQSAINKYFPDLRDVLPFDGFSWDLLDKSVENAMKCLDDRDQNGLRHGEKRQRETKAGGLLWIPDISFLTVVFPHGEPRWTNTWSSGNYIVSPTKPPDIITDNVRITWKPDMLEGRGNHRNYYRARETAFWPDATNEELSLPSEEMEKVLRGRITKLMSDFVAMTEKYGLVE